MTRWCRLEATSLWSKRKEAEAIAQKLVGGWCSLTCLNCFSARIGLGWLGKQRQIRQKRICQLVAPEFDNQPSVLASSRCSCDKHGQSMLMLDLQIFQQAYSTRKRWVAWAALLAWKAKGGPCVKQQLCMQAAIEAIKMTPAPTFPQKIGQPAHFVCWVGKWPLRYSIRRPVGIWWCRSLCPHSNFVSVRPCSFSVPRSLLGRLDRYAL